MLFLIAGVLILGTNPDDAPKLASNELSSEPRLARIAKVHVEGIAITDLLQSIGSKTGVSLQASSQLANEKVVILGPPRPIFEVLNDIASLLNGAWSNQGDSQNPHYVLSKGLRARQLEQRLRGGLAARFKAQLDAQVRALAETPEELSRRPESDPVRQVLLKDEFHGRFATALYGALSESQREEVFVRRFLNVPVSKISHQHLGPVRQKFLQIVAEEQAQQSAARADGYGIGASQVGDFDKSTLKFVIRQSDASISAQVGLGKTSYMVIGETFATAGWQLPPHGNPYSGRPISIDAILPALASIRRATDKPTWADRLGALSQGTDISIVSDYYRCKPVARAPVGPNTRTSDSEPVQALDKLCVSDGYLWWVDGNSLFFRKRDWYDQQMAEIPDSWFLNVSKEIERPNNHVLYRHLIPLAELTFDQIASLTRLGGRCADALQYLGFHRLLDLIKSNQHILNDPIHFGLDFTPELWDRIAVSIERPSSAQTRAITGLFAENPAAHSASPEGLFSFRVYSGWPSHVDRGYDYVETKIVGGFGNKQMFAYTVFLTKSLPDDRRNQSVIDVLN